jgi:arylsulfatase
MSRRSRFLFRAALVLPFLAPFLAAGCAEPGFPAGDRARGGAPRRERIVDLLDLSAEAQATLAAGTGAPALRGDQKVNTDDDRLELVTTAGTELRWRDVAIHPSARLAWKLGSPKEEPDAPRFPVRCRLVFEPAATAAGAGERIDLLDRTIGPEDAAKRPEGEIDLAALAGRRGDLVLVVEAARRAKARVAWSRLRLESDGRPELESDRVVRWRAPDPVAGDLAARFGEAAGESGTIEFDVPGRVEVALPIPPHARLDFFGDAVRAAAPAPDAGGPQGAPPPPPAPKRIAVLLRVRAGERVLREFTREVGRPIGNAFDSQVSIDLAELGGSEATLRFEAELAEGSSWDPADGKLRATITLPRLLAPREAPRQPRARGAPDLFLIVVDTLRADALGCYGSKRPTSPHLDEFARGSLLFERAYAPSSWTLPSTVSVLTGLHPDVHGARDPASTWVLDAHETIAEVLAARGLRTGGFVANTLLAKSGNFDQGFETWRICPWGNARKLVRPCVEWLDEHPDDRLFAYLHFGDPHANYDAPLPRAEVFTTPGRPFADASFQEILHAFGEDAEKQVLAHRTSPNVQAAIGRCRDLYDSEVRYFDRWFGAFLDALRERGRLDDSIIVLTADHGEEFLEHGAIFHGDHVYDETIHVPFLVRAPGLTPGRVAEPYAIEATKALVLELLGADDAGEPGTPRRSADEIARSHLPESIVSATELADEQGTGLLVSRAAIVRGRWKLDVTPELEREELYDLEADPGETRDLAAEQPRLRASLSQQLRDRRDEYARLASRSRIPVVPEIVELMRQLGYLR